MFGLENLSNNLQNIVTGSSSPDQLASGIWVQAIYPWLTGTVYSTMVTILIIVVVLFIFYGSFLYFTAYGDENRATMAKKTLTYAFVGLAISLLAVSIASYARAVLVKKDYVDSSNFNPTNQTAPTDVQSTGENPLNYNLFK